MADPNNSIVGTSVGNTSSGQPQNTEVGTGNVAAPGNPVVGGPPNPGAPTVPAGFVPLTRALVASRLRPLASQVSHVDGVVAELSQLATQPFWQGVSDNGMPSPIQLVGLFTGASAWSDESVKAKAWAAYANAERSADWDVALKAMEQFAPMLTAYLAAHPEMEVEVKATQAFIAARSDAAQRAVTTRSAPTVARARATKLTAQAAEANTVATAEEAAAALRHGTGDATITSPAPTSPAAAAPTAPKGGVTIT